MTAIPPTADALAAAEAPREATAAGWSAGWEFLERQIQAFTDRANPILVKETRQALKSRQFVVTFAIVLVACWLVSFGLVAVIGPQVYYSATGGMFMVWYYAVLAFPLAIIVPYTAFRSLASEMEDNTYDLLTITTLSARQIISGKLWSAVVQMIVYLSAVSPCLAFTFLLRGVDMVMTTFLLAIAVLGSLGLSMISLFVGTMARVKHSQIIWSVALVLVLFGAFWLACALALVVTEEGMPPDPEFWAAMVILLTIYITTFGLLHAAAAAQISFASENRSTPVRRWMMAQQACFVGGAAAMCYMYSDLRNLAPTAVACSVLATLYWAALGALMTAEWPHLSRRVQRALPQSTVGRTFLSFFNPGPGTGYMFAVSNLTAVLLAALVLAYVSARSASPWTTFDAAGGAIVLMWGYAVGYLGLGRLAIMWFRRWTFVSLAAGFLIQLLLVLGGVFIPLGLQFASRALRDDNYTLLQLSNPFWSVYELLDNGPNSTETPILMVVIPGFALAMLLLNMKSVAVELRRHRIAAPQRVVEEEAELHPAPTPGPSNPWDADGAAEA
jgi:hypothetical protein